MLKKMFFGAYVLVFFAFLFSNTVLAADDNFVYEFYLFGDRIETDTPMDRWGNYVPIRAYFEHAGCRVDWRTEDNGSVSALIFQEESNEVPRYVFNTGTNKINMGGPAGWSSFGNFPVPIIKNDRMQISTSIINHDFWGGNVLYDENGIMRIIHQKNFYTDKENILSSVNLGNNDKATCTILFDGDVDVNRSSYNGQKAYFTGNFTFRYKDTDIEGYYEQEELVIYIRDNPEAILFYAKESYAWGFGGEFYDEKSREYLWCELAIMI